MSIRSTPSRARRSTTASARPPSKPRHRTPDVQPASRRRSSSASAGKAGWRSATSFREVATCADDLCVIRSMHTDIPNHEPGLLMMCQRLEPADPPFVRLVAAVRAREREPQPARLRRPVPRPTRRASARNCGATAFCRASIRAATSITAILKPQQGHRPPRRTCSLATRRSASSSICSRR